MPYRSSNSVKLYGPNWSAYTRTARLALTEKAVNYELTEVDFSSGTMPEDHLLRHPFGKVPVLVHGDFQIYETTAICRYIDTAFEGPKLQPTDAQSLGRMVQIVALIDAYLSEEIRMGFVSERLIHPMMGMQTNGARVRDAMVAIQKGFSALGECIGDTHFFVGNNISLADLHAAPLFDYLALTPGGEELIHSSTALQNWWMNMKTQPSMLSTAPDLSVFKKNTDG